MCCLENIRRNREKTAPWGDLCYLKRCLSHNGSYDFTAVSTIIFLDRKGRHFNRSYPVVAADHPGYDQPAYIYRIWIWNVLEGPTGSCHGPSGIFTKFFYGKHDNRRPQCFAGIVDECRSVWSCRVFYGYDHFHHRSRADGMDRLSVQCGVYPVVYGIWLDRTFNVHL